MLAENLHDHLEEGLNITMITDLVTQLDRGPRMAPSTILCCVPSGSAGTRLYF